MNRRLIQFSFVFTFLLLCPFAHGDPAEEASRKPEDGCVWLKHTSQISKFSVLAQNCDFGFRTITHHIEGNSLVESIYDSKGGAPRQILVELFDRTSKKDPPEQVLKKLFIDKLNQYERQHCFARPTRSAELLHAPFIDKEKTAWIIQPDKEYQAKRQRETAPNDIPETVCGEYGVPTDSRAYFEFHPKAKKFFAWVVIGQDVPLFDEQSIEFE